MKFTRKQEVFLIDMAVQSIVDKALANLGGNKTEKKSKKSWTPAQRRKFQASMKKVWRAKKAAQKDS